MMIVIVDRNYGHLAAHSERHMLIAKAASALALIKSGTVLAQIWKDALEVRFDVSSIQSKYRRCKCGYRAIFSHLGLHASGCTSAIAAQTF